MLPERGDLAGVLLLAVPPYPCSKSLNDIVYMYVYVLFVVSKKKSLRKRGVENSNSFFAKLY